MIAGAPDAASSEGPDLQVRRARAAELSGGISGEPIYEAIDQRLVELGAVGALLDFGAGMGYFTRRLGDTGRFATVAAADLYPRPADLPERIRWVQADLNDRLPLPDGAFDVIVGAEVIEHLENPRRVARDLFRLLRPGGQVILSTPNNESWRSLVALLVRGHFVAFGGPSYPAHITALLRQDLEHVLREAGFVDPVFSFTNVGGIPGSPSHTWQQLLGRRARGLRFSDNVLVSASKPRRPEPSGHPRTTP
jgi:2-polyprenyl-3-methyl-5-hydroxy-6-metoxy-1,4-benzoquinol methylase